MYGEYEKSIGPKAVLIVLHAIAVFAAAWILFGTGFEMLFRWTGKPAVNDHVPTHSLVLACAAIYFARVCFATLHMYERKFSYGEAFGVGLYLVFIHTFYAYFGYRNVEPLGWITFAGASLYIFGSLLNTGSEYLRYLWKKNPRHKGHLYTGGLFHYSRHINYFGDELLFIGYALIAGSLWGFIIPAFMAFGFLFANIPMLESHLKSKYGAEFDTYALSTKKFVPYVL